MKAAKIVLSLILVACFACGESADPDTTLGPEIEASDTTTTQPQSPAGTVADMLRLAKAGEWGEMIDQYYGEADKFTSPDDREKLIQRFENDWGEQWISGLEKAEGIEPTIESDQAVFSDQEQTLLKLHRAEDGRWTFHL